MNLSDYIEMWTSDRDMIDTPSMISSKDNQTSTPSVPPGSNNQMLTSSVVLSSKRPCAGRTKINGTDATRPCKRTKMMPDDEAGKWYCKDHETER